MKLLGLFSLIIISLILTIDVVKSELLPAYIFHKHKSEYAGVFMACQQSIFSANSLGEIVDELPRRTAFNLNNTIKIDMISCFEKDLLRSKLLDSNVRPGKLSHFENKILASKATSVDQLLSGLRS